MAAPQSAFVRHTTHALFAVSQRGLSVPEHCASVVQPGTQTSRFGSQIGVEPLQSPFARHCTHLPVDRHTDADAGQSADVAHCSHVRVSALHRGAAPEQSESLAHPSHAPVVWSHLDAMMGHAAPPCVHDGPQVCVPGQHAGCPAPQSAFERQATHAPTVVSQNFALLGQSPSARHSTQPSVGLHLAPDPQALVLAQTFPGGMPLPLFELHAPKSATKAEARRAMEERISRRTRARKRAPRQPRGDRRRAVAKMR